MARARGPGRKRRGPAATPERWQAPPGVGPAISPAVVASLAALVAVAYHRVLFLGETFVERDALRLTLPSREFLAASLRAGRLPEWSDAAGFGAPFAANPVHEVLAPLGWILALGPMPLLSDLYSVLLVLLGGLGTAAFSRRLGAGAAGSVLAGAAVALGGYVTSMVPNALVPSLAWTPWVAWAADRLALASEGPPASRARPAALLAVAMAFQLHAGEPGSVLIAFVIVPTVLLARAPRRGAALVSGAAAALGSALLAAAVLLPGLLLLSWSARGAGLDAGGLAWSLHPARLLETVWPMAFGSQSVDGWLAGLFLLDGPGDPFWSYSLFVGLPVLVSAAAAWGDRSVRRLLVASAAFVLLALGPATPAWTILRAVFPPLAWVNFPEKFVYGALLLWAAAAGAGFSCATGRKVSKRLRAVAAAGTLALAVGVALAIAERGKLEAFAGRRAAEWGALVATREGVSAALAGGVVAALSAVLFVAALFLARRAPRLAPALALLAALGPLAWSAATTAPFAPRVVVSGTPGVLEDVAGPGARPPGSPRPRLFRLDPDRLSGPFRSGAEIARDYHESLDTNVATRFGLAVVGGFEPGESARSRRLGREVFPRLGLPAFVRLAGVSWVAARDPEGLGLPYPVASRGAGGWALLGTGDVRPRAFVAPRWRSSGSPERALDDLASPGRAADPGLVTLVDAPPDRGVSKTPLTPCEVRTERPEVVTLDCRSPDGGFAVLLDEWAPGWSAAVDGRPERILLADGLFRAVPVDPGARRVVFRYRTPGLRAGALVSLVSWSVLAVALVAMRRRPGDDRG